jgi:polar amino acid transport system substrate-binding protein
MAPTPALVRSFAPTGPLRVAINLGNPLLATLDEGSGATGISVDLGRALADELGVPCELVVVKTAGASVQVVNDGQADVGFFAIDPVRGAQIAFTAAYVLIEGTYLVRADDPITTTEQVDADGVEVVVGNGSAYDLFLSRELARASIVRAASSQAVVAHFVEHGTRVAAGVRQQLEADSADLDGVRVLEGHFMTIQQAVGVPKERGAEAAAFLSAYVERQKASGFVAESLVRHGVTGAAVAPPA